MTTRLGALLLGCGLAACGGQARGPGGVPLPAPEASATLMDSAGNRIGVAAFTTMDGGARLGISVSGLVPGAHGIHLHTTGECAPPKFESAGGHLNPGGREHGLENPAGPHAGDLPNLLVKPDGSADTIFAVDRTLLAPQSPLFDPDGTAVVVHAGRDDQRTDPSGNSGARVACGVIRRG